MDSFIPTRAFWVCRCCGDVASGLREIISGKKYEYAIFDKVLRTGDLKNTESVNASGMLLAWAFELQFPDKRVVVTSGAPRVGSYEDVPPVLRDLIRSRCCLYINKYERDADIRIRRFLKGESPEVNRVLVNSLILKPNIGGFGIDLKVLLEKEARRIREKPK